MNDKPWNKFTTPHWTPCTWRLLTGGTYGMGEGGLEFWKSSPPPLSQFCVSIKIWGLPRIMYIFSSYYEDCKYPFYKTALFSAGMEVVRVPDLLFIFLRILAHTKSERMEAGLGVFEVLGDGRVILSGRTTIKIVCILLWPLRHGISCTVYVHICTYFKLQKKTVKC